VHAITFDYRGIGASRPGDLASLEANVMDWATKDFEAMLGEAQRAAPELPLVLLGHCLGGQLLGLAPSNAKVRAALHVVAGSGYYVEKISLRHPILRRRNGGTRARP
jgi:predicted alpha/beta hydrolase